MKILLTNDDGILSPGLWRVAEALKEVGDLTVIAPDRDQSGIGTAMTLLAVVRAHEIDPHLDGVKAYAVEGTPADCVILATESLSGHPFDLVVSGINQGANIGMDVLVSGTVGGAFHGYLRGIPSVAVSVAAISDVRFEAAARTAAELARALSRNPPSNPLLLNVNLPNIAAEEIERVEITRLGSGSFLETVERGHDGRRTHYWIRHNRPVSARVTEGTDIWAIRNKRVSITPLDLDFGARVIRGDFDHFAHEVAAGLGL